MKKTRLACARNVRSDYLMCRPHWAQVSYPTQRLVYATLDAGGVLSPDYREAVDQAVIEVLGRNPA